MLNQFSRTQLLFGPEAMEKLRHSRVAVFGIGGVGGYAVEALARSGVGTLDLIDDDRVCLTNLNRQLHATRKTVGQYKVDAAKERVEEINPDCRVNIYKTFYMPDTKDQFDFSAYDYVIDAIDSIDDKINLILTTTNYQQPTLLSSMGAARKMDPLQVRVSEFWKVDGCPLAAKLRKRMRKELRFPARKFKCGWSPERNDDAEPKGTMMPVTATFGLTLASLVISSQAG